VESLGSGTRYRAEPKGSVDAHGHILARLIPNAELRMADDGHLFRLTRPAQTAAIIEEFLADESKLPT
jgi:hypothetical protein